MILTIAGADFSGANIGQNNSVTITLNKTGANGSKSSVTLKKGESVSSATVIATGLSAASGYENLVVTVKMNSSTVSGWFSNANGTVTIPSGTTITGNITITATADKIATGGGSGETPSVPTTTTYFGTDISIVSNIKDLIFVDGKMSGTGSSGFGNKAGRACSITQCLQVTGGQTVKLLQPISGTTLSFSFREFSALPLDENTIVSGGEDAGRWLNGDTKLQDTTKYIVITANNNRNNSFTANELVLLNDAFIIS